MPRCRVGIEDKQRLPGTDDRYRRGDKHLAHRQCIGLRAGKDTRIERDHRCIRITVGGHHGVAQGALADRRSAEAIAQVIAGIDDEIGASLARFLYLDSADIAGRPEGPGFTALVLPAATRKMIDRRRSGQRQLRGRRTAVVGERAQLRRD